LPHPEGELLDVAPVSARDGVDDPTGSQPDEIERVEVLKGEAAQALYGPWA